MCSSRVPLSLYRRGTDSCSIGFAEHVSSSGLGSLPVGFGVPPAESFSLFRLFASVSVFWDNTYTFVFFGRAESPAVFFLKRGRLKFDVGFGLFKAILLSSTFLSGQQIRRTLLFENHAKYGVSGQIAEIVPRCAHTGWSHRNLKFLRH